LARNQLLADSSVTSSEWCRRLACAADAWLGGLLAAATGGAVSGIALLAVGGYGRGELAPASDLDLLLVHDRGRAIKEVADKLWYPVWDSGSAVDHSVRTAREVRAAMEGDIKVALGLLDGRFVAGDAELARRVLERAQDMWQTRARKWLPALNEETRRRHARFGDLAFLLEPNLKESRGGLRDLALLNSLARVVPVLADIDAMGLSIARDSAGAAGDQHGAAGDQLGAAGDQLGAAGEVLTAARVELQRPAGAKGSETLLLQDQDRVAAALGFGDADDFMRALAAAGRSVAWASDDAWRRMESWLAGPRGRAGGRDEPLEAGLVLRDGEICVLANADPEADPSLALRTAAASAQLDRPLSRSSLGRLAAEAVAPSGTWPRNCLDALLRLLGAGPPAVAAIEALDQAGVWLRYLPEWEAVRNRPQRNAYHRYTVDRHLLETTAEAAALQHTVRRPDLLLLGALLHDIGKGSAGSGDHSSHGADIALRCCRRFGLAEDDLDTLDALVRHHLLLPEMATRRDLDDPATAAVVAQAVGDADTLALLAALTEADSRATGPTAWSDWKAGLVARLVSQVAAVFEGRPQPDRKAAIEASLSASERALLAAGRLELMAYGGRVVVAAPDRPGLLAIVAGVLSLSGGSVRSATTFSDRATAMALMRFEVAPDFLELPDWATVLRRLGDALDGRLNLRSALQERERHYARARRAESARPRGVEVLVDNSASTTSTVIEVHAPDRGALLYSLAHALSDAGVVISCALVSTLGSEAIDVFYVESAEGSKVGGEELARLEMSLRAALEGS
jgi:[protein-PII] uridylyltransferase